MKIVETMAITKHPCTEMCLEDVTKYVDGVYIRFDRVNGDKKLYDRCLSSPKVAGWFISEAPFTPYTWHEESIRMLDEVKPDVVICLDDDEMFDRDPRPDIEKFMASDKDAMMISYTPLPSDDGRTIINGAAFPPCPHMKIYKWKPGLTYKPYQGYARVTDYAHDQSKHFYPEVKIKHYCMFTKEMEVQKKAYLRKLYKGCPITFKDWGEE